MATALILVFLCVILFYAVAIYWQYRNGRKEIKMHFSREERETLAKEIEAVEIPEISHWPQDTENDDEETEESSNPS